MLGRLRQNGRRRVRITKITSVCVASDSTNQPVRNSAACACRTPSITANVAKSKIELSGPKNAMKRPDEPDVPRRRTREHLLVDVVGRDRHLARVVQQVVEQDLRREHRQEREECRRGRGAEHVPEVRRRRHQHVLDGVGEDATPLDDPVGQHAEVLVEQDDVGRVLRDVGAGVDGDADVGVVRARPRRSRRRRGTPRRRPRARCDADDARLRLGADACEHRRPVDRVAELARRPSRRPDRRSARPAPSRPRSRAHLHRDLEAVAGDHLDDDAEPGESRQRRCGVGLGPVDEHEEPGEREILSRRHRSAARVPARAGRRRRSRAHRRRRGRPEASPAASGTLVAAGEDALRARPSTISRRLPSGASATTVESRRSWSNGRSATRRHACADAAVGSSAASHSATSSAFPLTARPSVDDRLVARRVRGSAWPLPFRRPRRRPDRT